jgi:hypothetical protein
MKLEPRKPVGRYIHMSKVFFMQVRETGGVQYRQLMAHPGVTFNVGRNEEKRIARGVNKAARAIGVAYAKRDGRTWRKGNVGILAGLLDARRERQLGLAS